MNGAIACPACKDRVLAARDGGSRVGRLLAAGGLGLLAAIAGATVWIVIVRVTHYEIGLVAIGVGLLVGAAVRRGSGGRGGWGYQTLAVVLTYSAMVAYYVPYVLEGLRKGASEAHATSEPGGATAPAHAMLEPGAARMSSTSRGANGSSAIVAVRQHRNVVWSAETRCSTPFWTIRATE